MEINKLNIKCIAENEINNEFLNSLEYKYSLDIENLTFDNIKYKWPDLTLKIIMNNDKKYMVKYLKKLMKQRKLLIKQLTNLKILLINYDKDNQIHYQFKELIPAILSNDINKIYDRAYDLACDYLDSYFYGKNLCDFCNNKCGYKKDTNCEIGCCRHFEKHKRLGLLFGEKLVPCEHLGEDGHCTIKCMRCKLYSCPYLEKKGINFNTGSIFSLYAVFNPIQRLILNMIAYEDKSNILKIIKFFK